MLDLTLQSQSLLMNVPMACTSPTTKWRVVCSLMVVWRLLPSLAILMRKSQPCYANARTKLMVTLPAADYSHAFGHDMALALLPLGLGTPGTALEVSIL